MNSTYPQNLPVDAISFRIMDDEGNITKESIKQCLIPPYPAKYIINIIATVISVTILLLIYYGIIPTHEQGFFCRDPLFSHKYQGNTVTPLFLAFGILFLIALVLTTQHCIRKGARAIVTWEFIYENYYLAKYFVLGVVLVGAITEIAKSIIGEHRPDFFDVCKPDTSVNCTEGVYIYTFTCTNNEFGTMDLVDASRSFPSGHSSIAWFIAIYCAYIIQVRLPVKTTGSFFKIFMIVVCVSWGSLCSLTRITDRRHHWWDVLFGTVIGILGAMYVIVVTENKYKEVMTETVTRERSRTDFCDA
ncbi:putative phosphatidate phosphatase isoform X2 [Cylas formicarius]|uniref:putative phosphatidate phosphatase isoform X2 n=1 Tax=Cylas formicarius TaxID=197179 RepID=UPI0029589195|nr:putative phosphatidate phosphatase isoform X2 [Cylas formicarius]XP_060526648.1 putative phosphatidate phosphatase isoform X2 [Cylas formicarius]XP_060526658.1 putative phosphatidate phosphatase isoform X2 [Cylas formicarius]